MMKKRREWGRPELSLIGRFSVQLIWTFTYVYGTSAEVIKCGP